MINLYATPHEHRLYPGAIRDLRRELKRQTQQRLAANGHGSTINKRELEHRKRRKQMKDASRRQQRRVH